MVAEEMFSEFIFIFYLPHERL